MVFSSLLFLLGFLPVFGVCVIITRKRIDLQNSALIALSLFFYALGEPVYVGLMLLSVCLNYGSALIIERTTDRYWKDATLYVSVIINLGILGLFKYAAFFVDIVNNLTGLAIGFVGYTLPIGISFYTFQALSYTIDVYRGEVKAQTRFSHVLMYIVLFPQLIAGPIVRYTDIQREIINRTLTWVSMSEGIVRFTIGLFKKVCLANPLGEQANLWLGVPVTESSILGGWWGLVCFGLQIYFDFSGYSDMAIGLGKMMGFTFPENFRYPYISRSVSEFWRRWHMTLGSFFRDYVYIPLGGNRRFPYRNLVVVWLLTGLWHGANWNFILWGLFYGLFIGLEKAGVLAILQRMPIVIGHLYLLYVTLIGWSLFYFTDIVHIFRFWELLHGLTSAPYSDFRLETAVQSNFLLLAVALVACLPVYPAVLVPLYDTWNRRFRGVLQFSIWVGGVLLLMCSIALLVNQSYNPFIYFRF
jgi:alginate O-acetyltransferase complex protein AlgI